MVQTLAHLAFGKPFLFQGLDRVLQHVKWEARILCPYEEMFFGALIRFGPLPTVA